MTRDEKNEVWICVAAVGHPAALQGLSPTALWTCLRSVGPGGMDPGDGVRRMLADVRGEVDVVLSWRFDGDIRLGVYLRARGEEHLALIAGGLDVDVLDMVDGPRSAGDPHSSVSVTARCTVSYGPRAVVQWIGRAMPVPPVGGEAREVPPGYDCPARDGVPGGGSVRTVDGRIMAVGGDNGDA